MTHQWSPRSPCGPECLPCDGSLRRVGTFLVLLRLFRALGVLLCGAPLAGSVRLLPERVRSGLTRAWFRALLRAFGVRFEVRGQLSPGGGLIVSNHVSWLDVLVLQAACPMRLLAKNEVREWPLLGALADRFGTLYIDRDRLTTLPLAVRAVADALREGRAVGVFPEGTTWCGSAAGTYRPALFQAAVDAGGLVRPFALWFRVDSGARTTAAAFVGEETLMGSILTVARIRGLVAELAVLPEIDAAVVRDRRELARRAEASTLAATGAQRSRRAENHWTFTAV